MIKFLPPNTECECHSHPTVISDKGKIPHCSKCGTPWVLDMESLLEHVDLLERRIQQMNSMLNSHGIPIYGMP